MSVPRVRATTLRLALASGILIAGCSVAPSTTPGASIPDSPQPASATPAGSAPPPSASQEDDPLAGLQVASVEIPGGPDLLTEAFGSLWVLSVDGPIMNDGSVPSVYRIDPQTNEVVAAVEIAGRLCQGLGASPEAIWACGPDGLIRIDPATNAVAAEVPLDAALVVSRLPYGAGSVWSFATSGVEADTVVRVDPATNAVTASIPLGHPAGSMTYAFDALWVTSVDDDLLLRVDPATGEVAEWTTGVEGAGLVIADDDALWVALLGEDGTRADNGEPTVARIDPASGEVTAEIAAGASLETSGGIGAGTDAIWVRGTAPFLARIDPASGEVVDRVEADLGVGDVAEAFGSVWVTSAEGGMVYRLSP